MLLAEPLLASTLSWEATNVESVGTGACTQVGALLNSALTTGIISHDQLSLCTKHTRHYCHLLLLLHSHVLLNLLLLEHLLLLHLHLLDLHLLLGDNVGLILLT